MKRKLTLLAFLVLFVSFAVARTAYDSIYLVLPELVQDNSDWLDNDYVADWRDTLSAHGIDVSINEWNPKTGQIRLDQTSGQFSSNFQIFNSVSYPGAITKIAVCPVSGRLKKEDLTMTAGEFPYTFEQEAVMEDNNVVWYFSKKDDVRRFRIEAVKPEAKNAEKVMVPYITVCYEAKNRNGQESGSSDDSDFPMDSIVNPQPEDSIPHFAPQPYPTPIDQTPIKRIIQDTEKYISEVIGVLWPGGEDTIIPEPQIDGPTIEHFSKKYLLDQLNEEDLARIRAAFGEDHEYVCRYWSEDIPKIKKEQSDECLAILARTPYIELIKFVQGGIIENIMMIGADLGDAWNAGLGDPSASNAKEVPAHMPLLGEDLEEFQANPTDEAWDEFTRKANEKVPFFDVMMEYDLWDYIHMDITVEGL